MKKIIKSEIYHDGEFYCARCIDFDVFTQGETLDELVANLKEAIALHIEDEPLYLKGYDSSPSIFSMMELGEIYV
ncbi:MAG: type II toxin-antitoxin system HicB family antitoxin [Desulfamplus sp.]